VVTADRAYHAFCADSQGRASVFVMAPAMSWTIFWFNATWCEGSGDLQFCTGASDMRFRVEPTAGGTYRYTGGFVTPTPVP
jgi:hypothetical protein